MVGMQFFLVKAAAGHVMHHVSPSHVLVTVLHTTPIDKITTTQIFQKKLRKIVHMSDWTLYFGNVKSFFHLCSLLKKVVLGI